MDDVASNKGPAKGTGRINERAGELKSSSGAGGGAPSKEGGRPAPFFDASRDGLMVVGPDGRCRDANEAACRMLGRARRELVDTDLKALVRPEETGRFLEAVKTGGPGEWTLIAADGRAVSVELTFAGFTLGEDGYRLIVARDNNAVQRMEMGDQAGAAGLARDSGVLQSLLDNSSAIILLKDAEGRFVLLNKWYEALFGLKSRDALGKTDYDLFPREIADQFRENDAKVLKAGRPMEFVERALHPDGTEHVYIAVKFSVASMPGAVGCVATDITERERALKRLEESEKRLRDAEEVARIGCWDWDIVGNRLHWSYGIYRIFGIAPSNFVVTYEAFLNSVHPDDRGPVMAAVDDALYRKKPYSIEHRIVLPGGVERVVHEQAVATYDAGRAVRMVGTVQDVTDRKALEAELMKAQKLEAIGALAGGIAHDFNNILMGVMGHASVGKALVREGSRLHAILSEIEDAAAKARGLTKRLLTFSKGGLPVKEVVPVGPMIIDSSELSLKGSNVVCDMNLPPDLHMVDVDEGQIVQVLNNIIINAAQAMPDGGRIAINAENVEVGAGGATPLPAGAYVRITVRDSGVGIPKSDIKKVFEPFFTTKQRASGLGLAVSYSIIKKHGGYISVESDEGKGSAFHVYLPAFTGPSGGAAAASGAKEADTLAQGGDGMGRILVMDDEEIVRDVAGEMLRLLGYEAEFAMDGAEAVDKYRKSLDDGRPYRAVIMDLTIPGGMGGKEAVKRLVEIDPKVKAIVSSGYSMDPIMSEYRKFGFSGVITKPYRVADFSRIIKDVIGGK